MTGKPIFDIRLAGALFAKINSNVPTYADEFIFTKSELISRPLSACRQLLFLFFSAKNSDFADMTVILVRVCCTVTVVADITCFYRFREHILFKFA